MGTTSAGRGPVENRVREAVIGPDPVTGETRRVVFDPPRIADYRASVPDLCSHLTTLMRDAGLRHSLGAAGRERVVQQFDYRVVAQRFVEIITRRLGIN